MVLTEGSGKMYKAIIDWSHHGIREHSYATEVEALDTAIFRWNYRNTNPSANVRHVRVIRPDGSIAFWRQR
jgi:hypothetical protein